MCNIFTHFDFPVVPDVYITISVVLWLLIFSNEETESYHKDSRERITIIACGNIVCICIEEEAVSEVSKPENK